MKIKHVLFIISIIIMLSSLSAISAFASGSTTSDAPYTITAIVNNQTVSAQLHNGEMFLFLPASADCTSLLLSGNVTISDTNGNFSVRLTKTPLLVNLENLCGTIVGGEEYRLSVFSSNGKTLLPLSILKADNLSSVFVTCDKSVKELHTFKFIEAKGQLVMITKDGVQVNPQTTLTKFNGRGNSSWFYSGDKRPYNFSMEQKAEFINGAGSAKKWCLISDNCQGTWIHEAAGLANAAAYDMFSDIGGSSAIKYEFINLYINGEYRGVYILTEKVEIGSERVNITKSRYSFEDKENSTLVIASENIASPPQQWDYVDIKNAVISPEDELIKKGIQAYQYASASALEGEAGGFLLEVDRGFHGEASWFVTRHGIPYVIKEPEFVSKEQLFLIAEYVQNFEDALYSPSGFNSLGKYYTEYINLDSFVKKMLVDLATGQCDVYVRSVFFYSDFINGSLTPLTAGPAWDYDGSEYNSSYAFYHSNPSKLVICELFKHGDFASRFTELSNNEFKAVWENEMSLLKHYAEYLKNSYKLNSALWNRDGSNPNPESFTKLFDNISNRFNLWYTSFFDNSKLLGLTISENGNVISANIIGTADSIEWYKLSENGLTKASNASQNTFTPTESGIYYAVATGESETSLNVTSMYSNPLKVAAYSTERFGNTFFFNLLQPNPFIASVAEYNSEGSLTKVYTKYISSSDTIEITPTENCSYQAFLWNLHPIILK